MADHRIICRTAMYFVRSLVDVPEGVDFDIDIGEFDLRQRFIGRVWFFDGAKMPRKAYAYWEDRAEAEGIVQWLSDCTERFVAAILKLHPEWAVKLPV